MNSPLLIVVLLNWRNSDDTLQCLAQLAASTYPRLEMVVVDNGSDDGSVERIKSAFPDVPLICSPVNRGFAGGMNQGMQYAAARGADYVFLLNSDVTFVPEMLTTLVAEAKARGGRAIFSPRLYRQGPPRTLRQALTERAARLLGQVLPAPVAKWPYFWIYGVQLTPAGFHLIGEGQPDEGQFDDVPIDTIYGCALLIPRELLHEVGMLDERFFFFAEDTDYCLRARERGYPVVVSKQATLTHAVHGSTRSNSGRRQFLSARSRMLLLRKHYHRFRLPLLLMGELGELIRITAISLRYLDIRAVIGYIQGAWAGLLQRT